MFWYLYTIALLSLRNNKWSLVVLATMHIKIMIELNALLMILHSSVYHEYFCKANTEKKRKKKFCIHLVKLFLLVNFLF